ncbi:AMSH-like ubiquitin thioesterase 3 [Rutidosis leptorrhynchoides]|uniref:AMSH-like ubiquitin thioesterase 3 n=1 Tax=Rutidosis leptorrhynchoides TaxID=125765 RepID=UPI003A995B65
MRPPLKNPININAMARKIDVDDRIPLRNYYRIADNLLKQARIYREEKNIIDLYVMLLRYSSLVLDTIRFHRDYPVQCVKERAFSKKQLLAVIDELESLKAEVDRQIDVLNKGHTRSEVYQPNGLEESSLQPSTVNNNVSFGPGYNQFHNMENSISWNQNRATTQYKQLTSFDAQFQKLSLLPPPKQETLSRHSLLGPNGLRGQPLNSSTQIKVQYPTYTDYNSSENLSLIQSVQNDAPAFKDENSGVNISTMESVLSLDDGRWSRPVEDQFEDDDFHSGIIRQPSPPPVLARLQPEHSHISPSRVADPRPGPASFQEESPTSNTYHHLHIPVKMMQDFLRLAQANTKRNLETCGVLAGSLKNRNFQITTLIIPKQESTSDSCQTLNEEDIFDVQDKRSLFPLGWIHTHPTQTCFMSSVDLHTHYSYQIMLPEAVAIVMAPTDESSPHGIFHLSDPAGVKLIRNCDQRGFHPHEEPDDGSPIYEHCSHVYMNETLKFDVVDLR